jgi:hypothetical protein
VKEWEHPCVAQHKGGTKQGLSQHGGVQGGPPGGHLVRCIRPGCGQLRVRVEAQLQWAALAEVGVEVAGGVEGLGQANCSHHQQQAISATLRCASQAH